MKVTVFGSGNGGCTLAADWALAGHDVRLFDFEKFPDNINAINAAGGISVSGKVEGFAKLSYCGFDIDQALEECDLLFVVGPAYSTQPFGEACKGKLRDGQRVIIVPGSCGGALVFKRALGLDYDDERVIVGETHTLPYACRVLSPGNIHVYHKLTGWVYIAALPSKYTEELHEKFNQVNPCVPAKNVLQTTLTNGNPAIHPAGTLMMAAWIEATKGDFYFYEDGIQPGVGRLIKGVDEERMEIAKAMGFDLYPGPVLTKKQGYLIDDDYENCYRSAPGFKGVRAPSKLDTRYFHEDVGFGLVLFEELGKKFGVDTSVISSIITIASTIMQRDYRGERMRTLDKLGLDNLTCEELIHRL